MAAFASPGAGPVHAERLVPAYDPALHVKPPFMKGVDGESGQLMIDADFAERAGRYRREHAPLLAASGPITQLGEVAVLQGDDELLEFDGTGYQARLAEVTSRVIARFGDHFQAITVWLTFDESGSSNAAAYQVSVKNDV